MAKLFNSTTNKQGLIVFGGEASSDYGMVIAEAPTFERPTRKITSYSVPGRNGQIIYQQDAWDDVVRSYEVWIDENKAQDLATSVNAFEAWLNSLKGYQRLEDNFEPETFRLAYYNGGTNISNELMQVGRATISFTCRPERFLKTGEDLLYVQNGDKIINPTRFTSKPLIRITAIGDVTIAIGGNTISVTVADYMNIDSETMNVYRLPAENRNNLASGAFPVFVPGENTIGITGNVSEVRITPRWFTI